MPIADIETLKAIQKKGESRHENIDYCAGFDDHANAGVSVICAHDWIIDRH